MASGSCNPRSPCGACKFLRRKCASDCIFAPYFCSEQGAARFAAIHKVFGASNVSKLLFHVPIADRYEAAITIAYEAQARIRDPVYGCVAHIFALQQQVASLQSQLIEAKAQLAQNLIDSYHHNQWASEGRGEGPNFPTYHSNSSVSSQSSLDSIDYSFDGLNKKEIRSSSREQLINYNTHNLGELQTLALRMMRN